MVQDETTENEVTGTSGENGFHSLEETTKEIQEEAASEVEKGPLDEGDPTKPEAPPEEEVESTESVSEMAEGEVVLEKEVPEPNGVVRLHWVSQENLTKVDLRVNGHIRTYSKVTSEEQYKEFEAALNSSQEEGDMYFLANFENQLT